uniref:Uncharacterized protein n=1 Tax=Panstrongylus lignarius TaxID=156445 RepID=A0A224Y4J3_9HEMI
MGGATLYPKPLQLLAQNLALIFLNAPSSLSNEIPSLAFCQALIPDLGRMDECAHWICNCHPYISLHLAFLQTVPHFFVQ